MLRNILTITLVSLFSFLATSVYAEVVGVRDFAFDLKAEVGDKFSGGCSGGYKNPTCGGRSESEFEIDKCLSNTVLEEWFSVDWSDNEHELVSKFTTCGRVGFGVMHINCNEYCQATLGVTGQCKKVKKLVCIQHINKEQEVGYCDCATS